jgi:hypothetical protein
MLMDKMTRTRLKTLIDAHQRGVVSRTDRAHISLMRDLDRLCGQGSQKGVVVRHDSDSDRSRAEEQAARRWASG